MARLSVLLSLALLDSTSCSGAADFSPLGYRLEGHRRRSGIQASQALPEGVSARSDAVKAAVDISASGSTHAVVGEHSSGLTAPSGATRTLVRRASSSASHLKSRNAAFVQLEAHEAQTVAREAKELFEEADKSALLKEGAVLKEAAAAMPAAAADASQSNSRLPVSSLAEVAEGNDVGDKAFNLSGNGAMAGMVQSLVRWLRGGATYEEIYATQLFRQWLTTHHGEKQKASVLLQDSAVPQDWTPCADEGDKCNCASGVLRYGHGDSNRFTFKNVTRNAGSASLLETDHSIHCGNDFFSGDPAPGNQKSCYCMALWKVVTCRDGGPVDWSRCPVGAKNAAHLVGADGSISVPDLAGERLCSEGCDRQQVLISERQQAAHSLSLLQNAASASARGDVSGASAESLGVAVNPQVQGRALCKGLEPHDLLWSCDMRSSGRAMPNEHAQAQAKMTEATAAMCADARLAPQLEVYLDCDYLDNYKKWTKDNSVDWLDEAYVTYVGGPKDSSWEWQATNLVRSVELFSTRPIIVVTFTDHFAPPTSWRQNKNVLVYRMQPGLPRVSFNFNKIRSMIASRVVTGIQLDTDQIVASGMDTVFASTRREINKDYPFPMLPVHWMSRDAAKGEAYYEYHQQGYDGPVTMRWGQAHPTWTYHSLDFLTSLLQERLNVLDRNVKMWMLEDEDMLNVKSWQANATKQWCKFDLFPDLFVRGTDLDKSIYSDKKWYPEGIGLVFYAAHATKEFTSTDWLVALLARCNDPEIKEATKCPAKNNRNCWGNWISEQKERLVQPEKHTLEMCCCLRPRDQQAFYYNGAWYNNRDDVPAMHNKAQQGGCIFP